MDFTEKELTREDKFRGRIVYVHVDKVSLPDGGEAYREIVEHPGGVTVIPVDENGNVTMVRQYRYAFGQNILETPAGKLEQGENPLECAVRELSEETGFSADNFVYLGEVLPSPGYCKETLHIYLAMGLHAGKAHLDVGEFLATETYHIDTLMQQVMAGEITDAKTVIAIMKAKRYLEKGERN